MQRPDPASELHFFRQSYRSNYCAVYSTGMLLQLLGWNGNRRQLMALFGLRRYERRYKGTHLRIVSKIVAGAAKIARPRWVGMRCLKGRVLRRVLVRHFSVNGAACLLSFSARHLGISCRHVVVVTGIDAERVYLLDPLGGRPASGLFNRVLAMESDQLELRPASYDLLRPSRCSVLTWDPR